MDETKSIRFYYNGLRLNGEKKLTGCSFDLDNSRMTDAPSVTIYASDYGVALPRDLFPVVNGSNPMTDYSEEDSATLTEEHPLYKFARVAALKAYLRGEDSYIKQLQEESETAIESRQEFFRKGIARRIERKGKYDTELARWGEVGQPTDADLAAVREFNFKQENERIEAGHQAELAEREAAIRQRADDRRIIETLMEQYPLQEGQPSVSLGYSESGALGAMIDLNYHDLRLSPVAANEILGSLNQRYLETDGYDKTDFVLAYIDEEGDEVEYAGRFDIGSEAKDLLTHIDEFAKHYAESEPDTAERCREAADVLRNAIAEQTAQIDNVVELPTVSLSSGEPEQNEQPDLENLLDDTLERVFSNPREWADFLQYQARFYKYDFRDRLLLYAQNPNATACAEKELWETRMGRAVVREENGISLIYSNEYGSSTRTVFDVSDTEGSEFQKLWQYQSELDKPLIQALQPDTNTLKDALQISIELEFAKQLDNNTVLSYNSFKELYANSEFAKNSIFQIVCARCGIPCEPFSDNIPFFEDEEQKMALGMLLGDVSGTILRKIERAIKQTNLERRQEHEHFREGYDTEEGRETDGLWAETVQLSQGDAAGDSRGADDARDSVRPLSGSGRGGLGQSERTGAPDGESRGADRGDEIDRPDEVGRHHEQLPGESVRNRGAGDDLYLSQTYEMENGQFSLFGNPMEQNSDRERPKMGRSFSVLNSNELTAILKDGRAFGNGKLRIYRFYQDNPTAKQAVDYLKKEYGIVSHTYTFLDGSNGHISYDGKGLTIEKSTPHTELHLSWNEFEKKLHDLARSEDYLTDSEKTQYAELEQTYAAVGGIPKPIPAAAFPKPEELSLSSGESEIEFVPEEAAQEAEPSPVRNLDYQLLFRLKSDCDYFLGNGNRAENNLWGGSVREQIAKMREFYERLPEKPEWLTAEQIDEYERQMQPKFQVVVYHSTENGFDERAEYQTLAEAKSVAQKYLDGEMEDGFRYDGAAVYDTDSKEYVELLGQFPLEGEKTTVQEPLPTGQPEIENLEPLPISIPIDGEWKTFPNQAAAEQATYEERNRQIAESAQNFVITDNNLGLGGAKEKYRANVNAIRLMKQLEADNLQATPEQQEVLSRYVGWGGLADAFDENKPAWGAEFTELKNLLTPDEYAAAKGSVLNAHYTSPEIIRAIYMTGEDVDLDELLHFLRELPSVGEQPDTHAHWFEVGSLSCRCSACGCKNDRETAYCPHCDSKMNANNL